MDKWKHGKIWSLFEDMDESTISKMVKSVYIQCDHSSNLSIKEMPYMEQKDKILL